jgi:hypothetical protein
MALCLFIALFNGSEMNASSALLQLAYWNGGNLNFVKKSENYQVLRCCQ